MIDKNGSEIVALQYDYLDECYNDRYEYRSGEKYGFLSSEGKVVIDSQFIRTSGYYSDDYAVIATENKAFTLIDKDGNRLWGDKEFKGLGSILNYKFCKADKCYKSVYYKSDQGYCEDHYEEFEKPVETSSGKDEIKGDWSDLSGGAELNCYSSGNAYLTLEKSYTGTWSYSEDGVYKLDFDYFTMTAYVYSTYLRLYLDGRSDINALKLYKE